MQQGLRPFLQQDENSVSFVHRGGVSGKAFGGDGAPSKAALPGLPGQRKALGNITNRGSLDAENSQPFKTPAAGGPRRALGDITNNAHAQPQQLRVAGAEKPAGLLARPALAAKPASRVEAMAAGGVERLAGKGWQQLEAERREREDAEIDQRLLAFAALGKRSLPTFFPLWAPKLPMAAPLAGCLQHEELPELPPSPRMPLPQSGRSLNLGLEDFELPEISFALNDDDVLG